MSKNTLSPLRLKTKRRHICNFFKKTDDLISSSTESNSTFLRNPFHKFRVCTISVILLWTTATSQIVYGHDFTCIERRLPLVLPSPMYLWTKDIQQKNETVNLWVDGSHTHPPTHTHTHPPTHVQGNDLIYFLGYFDALSVLAGLSIVLNPQKSCTRRICTR